MSRANAAQDFLPAFKSNPDLHFDAERLVQGRTRLVGALRETLVAARALEYTLARQRLGAALHALQVTLRAFNLPPLALGGGYTPLLSWQHFLCLARRSYKEGKERGRPGGGGVNLS